MASTRASGWVVLIRLRNSIAFGCDGSKSMIKSCGSVSAAADSASLRDSTTRVRCRGANFFKADVIAAASAPYSSISTTLGAVPAGDSRDAGTAMATEKTEDRRSVAHVKAMQTQVVCLPPLASRFAPLLEAQGVDGVKPCGAVGRVKPEPDADYGAN